MQTSFMNYEWSTDETGLAYRCMPDSTLASKDDTRNGFKKAKERLTFLVTASMQGEKKEPLCIGKYANPRCFKNIRSFPCGYESQRKAWMNSDIFSTFLKDWDSCLRKDRRKILLLLDNAPSHKEDQMPTLSNIKLGYLPANTTAILQPCDQGIIALTKRAYKKQMDNYIIEQIDTLENADAVKIAQKIDVLQAMQMWTNAWYTVSGEAISNCWKKSQLKEWKGTESELRDYESEITFNLPYPRDVIERWIAQDSELETEAPVNEDEIINQVQKKFNKEDQSEDEDDEDVDIIEVPPVTCKEVKAAMEIMSRFMLETISHENEFQLHSKYKAMIQTKMAQKLRQGNLKSYFKAVNANVVAGDVADEPVPEQGQRPLEEVEDDVSAVDVGDVADEPVPELGQRPVRPVVDVQVREDHRVQRVGEDCNRKKLSSIFAQMADEQAEDASLQAPGVPEGVDGTAATGAHRGPRPTAAFGHGKEDNPQQVQCTELPEDAGDGQVHAAHAQQGDRESRGQDEGVVRAGEGRGHALLQDAERVGRAHGGLPEDARDGHVHAAQAQQGDREPPAALPRPLQLPTGDRRTRNQRKR